MYIPKIMIKEISCMGERMFTEAEISILEKRCMHVEIMEFYLKFS